MNVEKRMKICCLMLIDCILLTATCLLLSCSSLGRKKVCLPQLSFEISDKGLYEVNQTNRNGPNVISYFTPATLRTVLSETPRGKIDSIISGNPDWIFLFYISCTERDTGRIVKTLCDYGCKFSLYLDYKGDFKNLNFPNKAFSAVGYICDEDCYIYGSAVIGSSKSFFDSEFSKVKRLLR